MSWLQVWETDAFMAIVAYFDMLKVRGNPARGRRKKVLKGSVAILNKKKNVQGCASQNSDPMNSTLRKAGGLVWNASAGHT